MILKKKMPYLRRPQNSTYLIFNKLQIQFLREAEHFKLNLGVFVIQRANKKHWRKVNMRSQHTKKIFILDLTIPKKHQTNKEDFFSNFVTFSQCLNFNCSKVSSTLTNLEGDDVFSNFLLQLLLTSLSNLCSLVYWLSD